MYNVVMEFDLVLEGGGVKCLAYVGALQALTNYGHSYGRLIGTSVGSLLATLLAAGYTPLELHGLLSVPETGELVFTQLMSANRTLSLDQVRDGALARVLQEVDLPGVPNPIEGRVEHWLLALAARDPSLRRLLLFLEHAGIQDDGPFLEWLGQQLDAKSPDRASQPFSMMSLKQYYAATQRSLTLIAADITSAKMLILNHNTAPDCPLVWAVRMSIGVLPLFTPVTWLREWGYYGGESVEGHQVVDGGLLSNFPIELFLSKRASVLSIMDQPAEAAETLGLLLDDDIAVPGLPAPYVVGWRQRLEMVPGIELLTLLLRTTIEARDKGFIAMYPGHIIRLPVRGIGLYDFELTGSTIQKLISSAYNAAARFFTDGSLAKMQELSRTSRRIVDERAVNIITVYGNISGTGIAIGADAEASVHMQS